MLRHVAIIGAATVLLSYPVTATKRPQAGPRPAPAASLDEALSAAIARGDVPGLVAVAATRDRILYQGTFGKADVGGGRAMTADTMFRIASMTKPVTSVAAMQLFERGRFALDDPAEQYLPELATLQVVASFDHATGAYTLRPPKTKVTIRQLLTHTSGLGYGFTSPIVRDFKPRNGDTFTAGPLVFDPGTDWVYGSGIDWIGRLVEKLSGETLEAYFQAHIFTPLRMSDTSYNLPESKQARLVTVNGRPNGRGDAAFVEVPNRPPSPVTTFNGGGGLLSTAGDYIRFCRMILNGGTLDGARILSADTIALMEKNHMGEVGVRALQSAQPQSSMDFTFVDDGRDKWGIGFMLTSRHVDGKRSAGSLSWAGFFNTYFWIDPARGVAGTILMQVAPFADTKALAVLDTFERGVYRLADVP